MPHTVKDLIAALSALDPEMELWHWPDGGKLQPLETLPKPDRVARFEHSSGTYWHFADRRAEHLDEKDVVIL